MNLLFSRNLFYVSKSINKKTVLLNPNVPLSTDTLNSPEALQAYHDYIEKGLKRTKERRQMMKNVAVTIGSIVFAGGFFILSSILAIKFSFSLSRLNCQFPSPINANTHKDTIRKGTVSNFWLKIKKLFIEI